ncbi:rab-like protein 6 [Aplochiton taeniatus]
MFSVLKKLVGTEGGQLRDRNIPAGLQSMNQSLQRRFAKGVQYNMKIVIRGDRNTGKSALWHRLQGKKFLEEYIPTQEIQVTSIHWNYKTTDDIVKVEVWDVVDKGQKQSLAEGVGKGKKRGENLKLENEPEEAEGEMALDAEFLDVYKNCNGVIMMFDITKQWTFNYILRELPKVPTHVPVCVLGNQRDMGEHRVILPDDTKEFIANLNRPPGSSYIHYAECSMKNGFGLKYLHRFFNIPFLQLQRETLLRQLETNQLDIDATLEELNIQQETEDQNYDIFIEMMEARGRGHSSNGQSPSSGSQSPIVPQSGASTPGASSSPSGPQAPLPQPQPIRLAHPPAATQAQAPSRPPPLTTGAPPQTAAARQPPPTGAPRTSSPQSPSQAGQPSAAAPQKRGFISRLFGSAAPDTAAATPDGPGQEGKQCSGKIQNVDDFVPEVGLDQKFLEDGSAAAAAVVKAREKTRRAANMDSDSEGEGHSGNPMVSGFQDDLDPAELCQTVAMPTAAAPAPPAAASMGVTLTSDEEEEVPKAPEVTSVFEDEEDGDLGLGSGWDSKRSTSNGAKQQTKTGDGKKAAGLKTAEPGSFLNPSLAPVQPKQAGKKKGAPATAESSDSEREADRMLSYVIDDPDFDSEDESKTPRKNKDSVAVLEDLSDLSDDSFVPRAAPALRKPTALSLKGRQHNHDDELDLFGLGLQQVAPKTKDSSDEQDDKEIRHSTKDKKKKKKKSKEEDDKNGKKRHKIKKKDKEESGGIEEEKEKKKKKPKTRKSSNVDSLECFLGGGEGLVKGEGADYEEL